MIQDYYHIITTDGIENEEHFIWLSYCLVKQCITISELFHYCISGTENDTIEAILVLLKI